MKGMYIQGGSFLRFCCTRAACVSEVEAREVEGMLATLGNAGGPSARPTARVFRVNVERRDTIVVSE